MSKCFKGVILNRFILPLRNNESFLGMEFLKQQGSDFLEAQASFQRFAGMPVNVDAVVPARFRRAKPWEFFVRCPGGGLRWVHPSLVTSFCRENFEQKVSSMLFQGFSS